MSFSNMLGEMRREVISCKDGIHQGGARVLYLECEFGETTAKVVHA